jgi:hypothetical protein
MATTAIDLFCVGSLHKLRHQDVTIFASPKDLTISVRGLHWSGAAPRRPARGVSCYDSAASATVVQSERVRCLGGGSYYDDTLLTLWPDHPGSSHWNWSPAKDMPGVEFLNALAFLDLSFK